jgi:hypothetical protein
VRQAVVVIHGIGEQQPMGTIRSFVEAVLSSEGKPGMYYSKPDAMSELFELRRLQSAGNPRTDFYEYYWAYNVQGTKFFDVVFWMARLIWRRRRDIPRSLLGLWWLSRILMIVIAGLFVFGGVASLREWFDALSPYGLVWIATIGGLGAVQFALLAYIGDAARYLSPRPRNIKLRQKIRAEGVRLLKTVHESNEYDRIVVVGHSLGSIIGYDIITHLWQAFNEALPELEKNPAVHAMVRERMASRQSPQPVIRDTLSEKGEALGLPDSKVSVAEFQRWQLKAWREQRYFGNMWRVSDFVTLGSPLAHAMLLIAASASDFEKRKLQRELVTCPPQRDQKGYAYAPPRSFDVSPQPRGSGRPLSYTPLVLHHAAPFAVTRWTNLYFPVRLAFWGDLVGGRLAPVFGPGIKDVEVCTRRWKGLAGLTLAAHTCYWCVEDEVPREDLEGPVPALHALKSALALRSLRKFGMTTRFDSVNRLGHSAPGETESGERSSEFTASPSSPSP